MKSSSASLRFLVGASGRVSMCRFRGRPESRFFEFQRLSPTRPLPSRSPRSKSPKKQKELEKELQGPWKKWLNEDVIYIITDEERRAFKQLKTDEERQQFVEQFWLRRDPTPDTEENEYKEEHYRRIAYANDHYASGIPGWKTDRGMIYIKYGPADEIDSHPSGGSYQRPMEEGGGETSTYPFEDWRYRYIDGVGTNVIIEFVDTTMSGEYKISLDPEEKDALAVRAGRRPDDVRANGNGGQDAALSAYGRHSPWHRKSASAGEHERVHAARAVREFDESPDHQVQGSGRGRQIEHPVQHACPCR